jgi:hypothetical protein
MEDLKDKLKLIIEKSNTDKPACKNCKSYLDGACIFGCVNERRMGTYKFSNKKLTTPDYSCNNFDAVYNFEESTVDVLRDLLHDIERVDEGKLNLELLLSGKINESEFVDIMK